ncbi:Predicted restriction endonuclease [Saccharopolyspora kobensis]|uniref:Predicted restriction endonuclease n=1 Tax=Saccharopolyspora kobensis TaxID=146035 RepID=A0A1H6D617_9PSEU|nr:YDG/SRA domain-containing protein [Saccharopolyspora kobensis]SEG80418.1 Predicted restriction endonuclease [Saccharopolyspora kobensis]SFD11816.1 Predicted restriction endonuclease [Saccharopolyspora kobensis]
MGLRDLTRDAVVAAMAEHDELGQRKYCQKYDTKPSKELAIFEGRNLYDATSIVAGAHQIITGSPIDPKQLSTREAGIAELLSSFGLTAVQPAVARALADAVNFGEVTGVEEGRVFADRRELYDADVHRALRDGIVGTKERGAESIVLSGGYEDDEDHGAIIIYTGRGGQDSKGRQIDHQTFEDTKNAALRTNAFTGEPVRVIRGSKAEGYRYDGLFNVVEAWLGTGVRGYRICRYRLEKCGSNSSAADLETPVSGQQLPEGNEKPGRRVIKQQRIVRSTRVAEGVKKIHDYRCQVCAVRLEIGSYAYAEGAHIKPLGTPHNGPDVPANILCLCANCHVLFDKGAILIADDLTVSRNGEDVQLRVDASHRIDVEYLAYHRSIHA